jgi:hypothetical protein
MDSVLGVLGLFESETRKRRVAMDSAKCFAREEKMPKQLLSLLSIKFRRRLEVLQKKKKKKNLRKIT